MMDKQLIKKIKSNTTINNKHKTDVIKMIIDITLRVDSLALCLNPI